MCVCGVTAAFVIVIGGSRRRGRMSPESEGRGAPGWSGPSRPGGVALEEGVGPGPVELSGPN